jgi:hypothetical protein
MTSYKPHHQLVYHPEDSAYVVYELSPERIQELLATSVDVRYPIGITLSSFLAGYLDTGATRGRKQAYIATMCLGLFLFREGMQRELKIARTVERVVIEAEEGRQIQLSNISGKQRLVEGLKGLTCSSNGSAERGVLNIKDPDNPKSWYELEKSNALIYEKDLLEGILEGRYESLDTRD